MASLKLMSLCLGSHLQLQQHWDSGGAPGGGGGPLGPGRFSLDTLTLPTTVLSSLAGYPDPEAASLGCPGGASDPAAASVDPVGGYMDLRAASRGHLKGSAEAKAAPTERLKGYPDPEAWPAGRASLARAEPRDGAGVRLKNGLLQLPLCEKTISVNIQRGSREGLLCASAQASCCQVI